MKKVLISVLGIALFLWIVFFFAQIPAASVATNTEVKNASQLQADPSTFDFGNVSMKKGDVSYNFTIKNPTNKPVTVNKIYTSCMCTKVTFIIDNKKRGPFGMPGHGGPSPLVQETIAPNQEATIAAVFDPAAHGAAGIGRIDRSVFVESISSGTLELSFTATVTP